MSIDSTKSYMSRVFRNDSTRKGLCAAAAGFIVGAIIEAAWPTA
jgi:hypothetical protein